MEVLIQERVTQKENELNATYDEKLLNYEERYVDDAPYWLSWTLMFLAAESVIYNGKSN